MNRFNSYVRGESRKRVLFNKNRDRVSIVANILEIAASGTKKTNLMNSANLSFAVLEKYLYFIIGAGLIRHVGSIYELTDRGQEFLNQHEHFKKLYARAKRLFAIVDSEYNQLNQFCEKIHVA
jgi:predicted transcriptional regulator